MVASARRAGSSDTAIRDVEHNDLAALVRRLPALRAVAFNGGTAAAMGRRRLTAAGLEVATIALPSSSPLHTIGRMAKQPAWAALKAYL